MASRRNETHVSATTRPPQKSPAPPVGWGLPCTNHTLIIETSQYAKKPISVLHTVCTEGTNTLMYARTCPYLLVGIHTLQLHLLQVGGSEWHVVVDEVRDQGSGTIILCKNNNNNH